MVDTSIRKSLSALLDGETSEIETHRLLRTLDQDPGARDAWSRYQVISDVLQGEEILDAKDHLELSRSISASIAEEAEFNEPRRRFGWQRPAAGAAVAATVMLAVLFGVNLDRTNQPPAAPLAASGTAPPARVQPVSGDIPLDTRQLDYVRAPDSPGMADGELRELDAERLAQLRQRLMQHHGATRNTENYRVVSQPAR